MKDQGVMFSGLMVCALVDGRKKQTRRLASSPLAKAPPGTRFWVREAFTQPYRRTPTSSGCIYRADGPEFRSLVEQKHQWGAKEGRWTPAIHMPKWASRMTLILEAVRIERLHAISDADAIAEGIERNPDDPRLFRLYGYDGAWTQDPLSSYASLWRSLHKKAGERWEDNPEVAVFEFEVRRCNIELVER